MSGVIANVEAESALLGALMIEGRLIDQVADKLAPADFYLPLHANIYSAILEQAAKGKPTTSVAIKAYVENDPGLPELGGVGYLARLTSDSSALISPHGLADQLVDLAQRRRMADGLRMAAADCADLSIPAPEIVAQADSAISLKAGDLVHQPSGAECFDELFASYADTNRGVTCGCIPALDDLLGQMRPKQLIIGAGRPGMGKTALALSYALGAASRGHGVLFVSLEMSSAELAARMAADLCFDGPVDSIPYHAIRDGDLRPDQRRSLAAARDHMAELPFNVIDAGSLTVGRLNMLIRRHARKMAANGQKLELVIVDYLQLLSPDSKGRSAYEAVSEVSRSLKAMAKDNGIAVFALAQLSRSVESRPDKRPQLSDLRDSGQIEQDADAVLFLLRAEYYLRQAEPEIGTAQRMEWEQALEAVAGQIEFIVAKRRNGVVGAAKGAFHGMYQAVRGLEEVEA